ncbi:hypothetical protein GF343_04350 [Candidatus Woesearchaeota archaeon]|nr:hypothetical protein [Candidatus Woesearchaeota archaeon]
MNRLITTAILVILLSTVVLSVSEYECREHDTDNNVVMVCRASEEINTAVNKAVDSVSDAELLSKELSQMDQGFVKKFHSRDIQSQVHAYLNDVRNGVNVKLSDKDIRRIVEEDISYKEFINRHVGG